MEGRKKFQGGDTKIKFREEVLEEIITEVISEEYEDLVKSREFYNGIDTEDRTTISETYEIMDKLENVAQNTFLEILQKYYEFRFQLGKYLRNNKNLKLTDYFKKMLKK